MATDKIDQALALKEQKRFDEALSLLWIALAEDPLNWYAWYLAGQCSRFLNDIKGAITQLSRAAELMPNEPEIFLGLGIALQLGERWDDAINALQHAIELDSDMALAYNSLALTYIKNAVI